MTDFMTSPSNPHTLYYPGFSVCHWKNRVACGAKDDWDVAEFQAWSRVGVVTVKVTETLQYERMLNLLTHVHESGVFSAKKEIREVLGVRE